MRLFLNKEQNAYLRGLATEFQTSPSLIKDELKQLIEQAQGDGAARPGARA